MNHSFSQLEGDYLHVYCVKASKLQLIMISKYIAV